MQDTPIILASSSAYRKALLERLQIPFQCISPDIDETPEPNEPAEALVKRLSLEKAKVIQKQHSDAIIIGSDQVACLEGKIMGKPGSAEKALQQLMAAAGNTVTFHTGLCLLTPSQTLVDSIPYKVIFNAFDEPTAQRYIEKEQPLDCAGSFKSEGLGISLFRAQQGDDPTSLVGLPLIKLCEYLRIAGLQIP